MALSELEKYGECVAIAADVTDSADRKALVSKIEKEFGRLSILINNAGANWSAKLEDYPDADFAKVWILI